MSLLERWRHGPRAVSGKAMVAALTRTAEIGELGVGESDLSGVPPRRVIELARYGMAAKAPALRRLPRARRIATVGVWIATLVAHRGVCSYSPNAASAR